MAKREENEDELRAREWLRRQGYRDRDIQRQCNDPPDFVVDGVYAVEVIRLNQRVVIGNSEESKGEEEYRIPLTQAIERIIRGLGPPANNGPSWVVDVEYDLSNRKWLKAESPKPKIASKIISNQISEALAPLLRPYDKHAGETSHLGFLHLRLDCGISLELTAVDSDPASFIVPNVSDGKGMLVDGELRRGIRNCVLKKNSPTIRRRKKVGKYKDMPWWLILIDHIYHLPMQNLSEHELSLVRDQRFDSWSRVVIVSSRNPSWYYDLISR